MDEALEAVILADADDDEVEQVILHNIFGVVENFPIGAAEDRFNLDNMMAEDIKINFRFERDDIFRLAAALHIPDVIRTQTRDSVPGVMGLCILLRRLAYPGRLKDLQLLFGLSPQSLSQIINHMQNLIANNFMHLLDDLRNLPWLNLQRMHMYADAIHGRGAAISNCWGFIDGTARPICRPSINQEEYYSGHKRFHCVKYQSVICPDGMITSLKGAYVGRRHDAGIFRESNLYAELQDVAVFLITGLFYMVTMPTPLWTYFYAPFQTDKEFLFINSISMNP
ncbi:uncharacterized protein [Leptinotarsa decemlineata]|uniref:uncharacterized protein n=1 Tax=Leptinotarsa decemlineata TaxID=7539 RepID=UPI003D30C276